MKNPKVELVEISRFVRGNQGETRREVVKLRIVHSMTVLESPRDMAAQAPIQRRVVRFVRYGGERYEVRPVDPESTFLPDVALREAGVRWTLQLRSETPPVPPR